jgi:hypothetical protein
MTRANRAWIGFLVAPGCTRDPALRFQSPQGLRRAAVVGPILLALPAYASALFLGLPAYLLLKRHGLKGIGTYAGSGTAIGLASVVAVTVIQMIVAWTWTPDDSRALSLWRYSGRYMVIAMLYAAIAGAVFSLIAIRERQLPKQTLHDVQ